MNTCKSIFFISTNNQWGASEYLWYQMANNLIDKKVELSFATKYQDDNIRILASKINYININSRTKKLTFLKRVLNKIYPFFKLKDQLRVSLIKDTPDLIIISQGNNIGSEDIMNLCSNLRYKYVVITHLVAQLNYQSINEKNRIDLINCYNRAEKIFFVSKKNHALHEKILGYTCDNFDIAYNPLNIKSFEKISFPNIEFELNCAIVGRIEFYHKGIDILLDIISQNKWLERNIMFNFYGDGPHLHQLKYFVGKNELKNVKFHGHIDNVTDVWKANHILILPSRMEGQSVSLSEALAFSRTVVATNVGGVSEFLTDNVTGFISEDVTISSFENAMERMWKRKDKLEKIGKEAHLSWVKKVPKDPIEYIINLLQLH